MLKVTDSPALAPFGQRAGRRRRPDRGRPYVGARHARRWTERPADLGDVGSGYIALRGVRVAEPGIERPVLQHRRHNVVHYGQRRRAGGARPGWCPCHQPRLGPAPPTGSPPPCARATGGRAVANARPPRDSRRVAHELGTGRLALPSQSRISCCAGEGRRRPFRLPPRRWDDPGRPAEPRSDIVGRPAEVPLLGERYVN